MTRRKEKTISSPAAEIAPLPFDDETWSQTIRALELSPQQARIVELLLQGMQDKHISQELGLGVSTVRTYLNRIFVRASVRDRVELILKVFAIARPFMPAGERHHSS